MSATEIATFRRGRPLENAKHPLMAALKKARVTVAEEAKAVGRSPASVRSFCYKPSEDAFRPVPRELAERWRDKYGVPMATWRRIAE